MQAMARFWASAGVSPGRATFDLAMVADSVLLGCRKQLERPVQRPGPDRVVFGYNATDALNLAIFGRLRSGGHVVSTRLEHNSVLRPIAHAVDDFGARATWVPFDGQGYVDPDDIKQAIEKDTRLVVVNHASNVLGTLQPVSEIGAICREAGVPLLHRRRAVGRRHPIDMQAMNVDIVAFTGHKSLMGPMGIGGLCVGEGVELAHTRAGGTGVRSAERRHLEEYPFRLEYGTPNMLGIAGLSRSLALIAEQGGVSAIHAREMELARVLWEALRETEGVTHVLRRVPGASDAGLRLQLRRHGPRPRRARGSTWTIDVACRTGLHCAPLVHESLGTAPDGAVRVSIGPLTTLADVEAGAAAIRGLAAEIRS